MDLISVDGEGSKRKREELLDELVDNEPAKRTPHDFKIADFRDEDEPADEKANDSEGDEDKDDDEKDTVAVFDEEKFFLSPSFTPEELADASNRINAAFQAPLRCLEKGGHTVYMDFLKEREMKARINNIDKSEQMQQMIEDATIQGDPRGYQQALFQIAKRKNTIINLGTGYGKTLIALLCIRHFSQAFEEGKHTLFLVPSVALAIQVNDPFEEKNINSALSVILIADPLLPLDFAAKYNPPGQSSELLHSNCVLRKLQLRRC